MWKLTKGNEFLPNVSVKRLQEMYDEEKNAKAKLRLLSAVHRKRGKALTELHIFSQSHDEQFMAGLLASK